MLQVFVFSVVIVAIAMLALSVGVILTGKCFRGSCGGESVVGDGGDAGRCGVCGREREHPHEDGKHCERHAELTRDAG